MFKKMVVMSTLMFTAQAQAANVVTQWNFNSVPADSSTSTGSLMPSTGVGSLSLLNVTQTFASGTAGTGSSDPATADNSGMNVTGFAAQGTNNKLYGVQFNISTFGMKDVVISYDLRHSNTSSRYEQFQYSLDGTSFIDFAVFDGNAGDTWFNNRTIDLSSIVGVSNNASFAFRVVSVFAPSTSTYVASRNSSSYGTAGTWRFDMVTLSATPVPEADSVGMLLAGLGVLALVRRRQSR